MRYKGKLESDHAEMNQDGSWYINPHKKENKVGRKKTQENIEYASFNAFTHKATHSVDHIDRSITAVVKTCHIFLPTAIRLSLVSLFSNALWLNHKVCLAETESSLQASFCGMKGHV